jgi:hypothetical protein
VIGAPWKHGLRFVLILLFHGRCVSPTTPLLPELAVPDMQRVVNVIEHELLNADVLVRFC